jgi:hypothetical protein
VLGELAECSWAASLWNHVLVCNWLLYVLRQFVCNAQGREGKVVTVYRKKWVIEIERITREKVNGGCRDLERQLAPLVSLLLPFLGMDASPPCSMSDVPLVFVASSDEFRLLHAPVLRRGDCQCWHRPFQGRHHEAEARQGPQAAAREEAGAPRGGGDRNRTRFALFGTQNRAFGPYLMTDFLPPEVLGAF